MLGSNFALLVRSPGDDGEQLLTTGSRIVCTSLPESKLCSLLPGFTTDDINLTTYCVCVYVFDYELK